MALSDLWTWFQKLFSHHSKSSASGPALPPELGPSEQFSRFILWRNHFAREKGRIKAQALLPAWNSEAARYETSTYRNFGLTEAEIWQLGYEYVERRGESGRTIRARGIGTYELAVGAGLACHVNGEPHPRHVDLTEWPPERDARLMKATELADTMVLKLDPR